MHSLKTILTTCLLLTLNTTTKAYITFNHPTEVLAIVKPYLPENPIILEAGAYDGADSLIMKNYWPKAQLHTFEPIPQLYQQLVSKTETQEDMYAYKYALGDYIGIATFYVSEFAEKPGIPSASSSLLRPKDHLIHAPHVLFNSEITVPIITIDEWAKENGVKSIDFMWLDMQGYELNALKAAPQIMKTVKAILTEVEFVEAYEGQYLFDDVKTWLEEQGFVMIARNFYCNWFADALFVRK